MVKRPPVLTAFALLAAWAVAGEAQAQMFGSRSLGSSLSRRSAPSLSKIGAVRGSERYVRGNRRETNFVGADSRDIRGFVGSQAGASSGRIRSAVSGLRVKSAPDANRGARPTSRSRTSLYEPRLRVDFGFPTVSSEQVSTNLSRQLETSLTRHLRSAISIDQICAIEVSLEGQKATLRGEVSSERERKLAELLALFEPGISEVQNELIVRSPAFAAESPPRGQADSPTAQPDQDK